MTLDMNQRELGFGEVAVSKPHLELLEENRNWWLSRCKTLELLNADLTNERDKLQYALTESQEIVAEQYDSIGKYDEVAQERDELKVEIARLQSLLSEVKANVRARCDGDTCCLKGMMEAW